ncbi:hypothetical protein MM5_190 [Morganella phage vB_Mm5]
MKNEKAVNPVKRIVKLTAIGVAVVAALAIGSCSITVVPDGTVKTQKVLGEVRSEVLKPGFHVINPISELDVFSVQDQEIKFEKLMVPSQDKFKTAVDISVMIKFDGSKAPTARINAGVQSEALNRYVVTKLTSTVYEFGKSVKNAQDLFNAETQTRLQQNIREEVNSFSMPYGYTITEVFIQDIELDPTIKTQITNTKLREEKINQARADLDRVEKEAQQKVKQAEADRASAEEMAKARERDADATLYAAKKEAEANQALQKTITPEMIRWKELDVEQTRANKYKGDVPSTVVGADYKGALITDIRK